MESLILRIKKISWNNILNVMGTIGFFYLILYGFLKVLGIIHSPPLIDITAIASMAVFSGKYLKKVDY